MVSLFVPRGDYTPGCWQANKPLPAVRQVPKTGSENKKWRADMAFLRLQIDCSQSGASIGPSDTA